MIYYNQIDTFFNAVQDVFIYLKDMLYELLYFAFGYENEFTVYNLWFILAFLPGILGLALEILFSFILSFRARKLRIFVPWRASSYSALRVGYLPSVRAYAGASASLLYWKRGKTDTAINGKKNIPLLSFQKKDVLHSRSSTIDKPIKSYSNQVRRFIPRLTLVQQKLYGFKQSQRVYHGLFKTVYYHKHKK